MKLRLPHALLVALVACISAPSAYAVTVNSLFGWELDTVVSDINGPNGSNSAVTYTGNNRTYTFTLNGDYVTVSGMDSFRNNITFQFDVDAIQSAPSNLAFTPVAYASFQHYGGYAIEGSNSGTNFATLADSTLKWSSGAAKSASGLNDDGIVTVAYMRSTGTTLANGLSIPSDKSTALYHVGGLMWSTNAESTNTMVFNTKYVDTVYYSQSSGVAENATTYRIADSTNTWTKTYTSAFAVGGPTSGDGAFDQRTTFSSTRVGVTIATGGRMDVTSANVDNLNRNGGDIVVASDGQLYFNANEADLTVGSSSSTIYIGSSTYDETTGTGVVRFGNGCDPQRVTTINSKVVLIEDSTMGSDTANGGTVKLMDGVTGEGKTTHTLTILHGDAIEFHGDVSKIGMTVNAGATIAFAGDTNVTSLGNAGTVNVMNGGVLATASQLGGAGSLNVLDGGSLVLSYASGQSSTYTLGESHNVTFADGAKLVFGTSYTNGATIDLSGVVGTGWDWDHIQAAVNNGLYGYASASYDAGTHIITISGSALTWNGGTSGTWNTTSSNEVWTSDGGATNRYFRQDSEVVFNTANANITAAGTSDAPLASRAVTINANTTFTGGYIKTNALTMDGGTLTLAGGSTLQVDGEYTAGTVNLRANSTLKVAQSGSLTLGQTSSDTGALEVAAGATVNLGSFSGDIRSHFSGSGNVELTASGGMIVMHSTGNTLTGTLTITLSNHFLVGNNEVAAEAFAPVNGKYVDLVLKGGSDSAGLILNKYYYGSVVDDHILNIGSLSSSSMSAQIRGDYGDNNGGVSGTKYRYVAVHQDTDTVYAGTFRATAATGSSCDRSVGLIMNGSGTLTLTGANESNATLIIKQGTIELSRSGKWSANVEVSAGGQLFIITSGLINRTFSYRHQSPQHTLRSPS